MMATSRIPATIEAVVAAFTAAGLQAWDGPIVTGDYAPAVHVGYDGDPEGDFRSVSAEQEWAGIGAKRRDEQFDVICSVTVRSGDTDIQLARDLAYAMLATIENTLRADPSLGQSPPFVAEYRPGDVHTENGPGGWQIRAVFNVHVKTRI